jgi:hypothetical protein
METIAATILYDNKFDIILILLLILETLFIGVVIVPWHCVF